MIKEIIIKKEILHFQTPYKIAYETAENVEVIYLKIVDDKGRYGLGSINIDEEISAKTGETVAKSMAILRRKLTPKFFNEPISRWYYYHEKIQETFAGYPATQSAVEEAVLNLWSEVSNFMLKDFFGGYRETCPIIYSIGMKSLEETKEEIIKKQKQGFKIFKLKCGLDLAEDIAKVKMAREILPKKYQITLDANQGYSFSDAKKFLQAIEKMDIALFEQPVAAEDLNSLKKLYKSSRIPIIADEAVVSMADAIKILTGDYAAGVNIKLLKCGGPINFLKIFHLAKSLNKIAMIGCMYESNITITTGANLALGLPIDFTDLDTGHLDFPDEPARGGAIVENGEIRIGDRMELKMNKE